MQFFLLLLRFQEGSQFSFSHRANVGCTELSAFSSGQQHRNNLQMKNTAFTKFHEAMGAKMVPFAGYYMPLQYEGVIAEHETVRKGVGVFDQRWPHV